MKTRALWIDNLRSFVILLVVAHHAALAYTTFAFFNKEAYAFSPHPMADTQRWLGMDYFQYFNDIFLMALMFFISGLFITSSLNAKGKKAFLKDRFNRLFITFFAGATIFLPLAMYPAYVLAHGETNIKNFIIDFFTIEQWPIGPPWFIWVLFLFNLIFVLLFKPLKKLLDKLSNALLLIKDKPFSVFVVWFLLMWILYVPMRIIFGPYTWTIGYGPFDFQKSTIIFYFGYFLLGAAFGNIPHENGIFSDSFSFIKKWKIWVVLSILSFTFLILIDNPFLGNPLKQFAEWTKLRRITGDTIYNTFYVATCSISCIAFLSLFKAWVNHTNRFWDSMASNSFFIYLIHYIFIVWAQYILLPAEMPALLKFTIVTLIAIIISWLLSYWIHKITIIRQYI